MAEVLEQNIRTWAASRPTTMSVLSELNKDNLRWAVFSGSLPGWLDPDRQLNDLDIITSELDFDEVKRRLPGATACRTTVNFASADGAIFSGETDKVTAVLDDGKTEIEIMRPFGLRGNNGRQYFFELTPWAARACKQVEASGTHVPLDVISTKVIKATFGRAGAKSDIADIRTLNAHLYTAESHLRRRVAETGGGQRELQRLGLGSSLGHHATLRSVGLRRLQFAS